MNEVDVHPDKNRYWLLRHRQLEIRRVEHLQFKPARYLGGPVKPASVTNAPKPLVWVVLGLGRYTAHLLDQSKCRVPTAAAAVAFVVNVRVGTVEEELGREGNSGRFSRDGLTALHRTGCGEGPTAAAAKLVLDISDGVRGPPVDLARETEIGEEVEVDNR